MANEMGFNPWLRMWTHPKSTIRSIVNYDPNYRLYILSAIYGFVSLIGSFQSFALGRAINFYYLLIIGLIIAPIWGYLIFSFASFFIHLTGKWLKGQAKYKEIRACIAWSNVPMIGNLILWIFLLIIFKSDIFNDFPGSFEITIPQRSILFIVMLSQLILSIWVIVLYINSLAEVQKFSVGKSVLNMILAVILFIGIFFVVSFISFLIIKGFNLK